MVFSIRRNFSSIAKITIFILMLWSYFIHECFFSLCEIEKRLGHVKGNGAQRKVAW